MRHVRTAGMIVTGLILLGVSSSVITKYGFIKAWFTSLTVNERLRNSVLFAACLSIVINLCFSWCSSRAQKRNTQQILAAIERVTESEKRRHD